MFASVLALASTATFAAESSKPVQLAQTDKMTVTNPAVAQKNAATTGETAKSAQQARGAASVPNRSQDTAHKMGPRTGAQMAPHDQSGNAGQGPGQTGYRKGPTQMAPHDQSGNAGQGPGQTGYRKGPTQMAPHDQSGNAGQGPGQTGYGRKTTGSTVGQPNPNARAMKGAQMAPGGAEGQGPGQSPPGGQRQTGGGTAGQPNPAAHKGMAKSAQMQPGAQSGNAGQGPGQTGYERNTGGIAGQPNPAANAVKGMK